MGDPFLQRRLVRTALALAILLGYTRLTGASTTVALGAFFVCLLAVVTVRALPTLAHTGVVPRRWRRGRRRAARTWPASSVVIYCPPWIPGQQREWGPGCTRTGLGGAEEAVVYLSRALVRMGYQVTVFNRCGETHAGEWGDGVVYRPVAEFDIDDTFRHFILWRSPEPFVGRVRAYRKVYWTHDAPACMLWASVLSLSSVSDCLALFTKLRRSFSWYMAAAYVVSTFVYWPRSVTVKFDCCVALTDFHSGCLRPIVPLPDRRVITIGNGVVPEQFATRGVRLAQRRRDPLRVIYPICYARGLERLLRMWPRITARVPGASLHIFFGWNGVYNAELRRTLELLMDQPGVHEHGRIGHEELIAEYAASGVFAYPSSTPEAYSISTLKAILTGAVPVVTSLGALPAVCAPHEGPVVVSPHDDDEAFFQALVTLLENTDEQERRRAAMRRTGHPDNYAWDRIAESWDRDVFGSEDLVGILDEIGA
jgi:glycosyltransferase involved in cell wall biosynthesis